MSGTEQAALHLSANGLMLQIEPSDLGLREDYEALIREDYARCKPGDSLEWLKHRSRFSKLEQGILYEWIGIASKRVRQQE